MFQGTILERKWKDIVHIGLRWVKNGCSLYCARFPLALLLANINLRYAAPPLILLGFINGRLHPRSAAPNLRSPSVAPDIGWLLLVALAVNKFSCLS